MIFCRKLLTSDEDSEEENKEGSSDEEGKKDNDKPKADKTDSGNKKGIIFFYL